MSDRAESWTEEIARGERFAFGENWRSFAGLLDDERIAEAAASLAEMLGVESLDALSFLDVGCGSGLFSLAAMRLGAARVHSLDFDPASVATTTALRERFTPGDRRWVVAAGDALDESALSELGEWDVVYAWGVLHHTGDMWRALELVAARVGIGGRLFLAIYNDQGLQSRCWHALKRLYNRLPPAARPIYTILVMGPLEIATLGLYSLRGRPLDYVRAWTQYKKNRGMSRWHNLVDWIGGYPFEVARPEQIVDFYRHRGFELDRLNTCGRRWGCNEFVLRRVALTT